MAKGRPYDERIADIEEKQRQLEEQKRTLISKAKEQDRKERTRRLIQIGAIFDNMGIHTTEQADTLKTKCINDERLWERIIKSAGAPWPPDTLSWKALQARKGGNEEE